MEQSTTRSVSEKQSNITRIEKVLYTAKAHTTGGRDGGASRTDDGHLDVKFSSGRLVHLLPVRDQVARREKEDHVA